MCLCNVGAFVYGASLLFSRSFTASC
jgi:hypothetical protein